MTPITYLQTLVGDAGHVQFIAPWSGAVSAPGVYLVKRVVRRRSMVVDGQYIGRDYAEALAWIGNHQRWLR